MNTADRSIALMDLALRRRFVFREMLPDSGLLDGIFVGDIDIRKMFETINKRIEYLYDRDHAIGHSFFLLLKKTPTLEALNGIFLNGIIPLLQEYFYDDWEKIQIVLGDHPDQKGFKNPDDRIIRSEIMDKKSELGFDFDDGMTGKPSYAVHAPENSRSYV
jgi:5-methylcytosine-specific restriction endonuclease McrBC GTP-binding regulatory subunit McrB